MWLVLPLSLRVFVCICVFGWIDPWFSYITRILLKGGGSTSASSYWCSKTLATYIRVWHSFALQFFTVSKSDENKIQFLEIDTMAILNDWLLLGCVYFNKYLRFKKKREQKFTLISIRIAYHMKTQFKHEHEVAIQILHECTKLRIFEFCMSSKGQNVEIITRNDCSFSCPVVCVDTVHISSNDQPSAQIFIQNAFVYRHLNNVWYKQAHSLFSMPYLR